MSEFSWPSYLYLSVYLSIYLSIHLYLSIYLSSIYLYLYLSIYPSIYLYICMYRVVSTLQTAFQVPRLASHKCMCVDLSFFDTSGGGNVHWIWLLRLSVRNAKSQKWSIYSFWVGLARHAQSNVKQRLIHI